MKKFIFTSLRCVKHQLLMALFLVLSFTAFAQTGNTVSGKISDASGDALIGASVLVKGTTNGTITDANGNYTLNNVPPSSTLVVSFIGSKSQEISSDNGGNVTLQDGDALDEVVVTGTFDKRTRLESSVAISVLSTKQLERLAPISSADLLKNIPGVFVNSSLGEIRNTVYSRGVSVGSNDGASGYYYVSMQEDGLPVTNATYGNYGPDYFMRPDATLGRLEAIRGGTASILGNNAPGGIFNYVSKTGGQKFEGEARVRYGMEGDQFNPYYRADLDFGGPLSKDGSMTYNIGGFYRQADGAKYPGYPMNNGGQVKGNIVKTFGTGSLKLYVKYLDDKNAWFEFTPTIGFTNPQQPAGITQQTSVINAPVTADFTVNESGVKKHYDSRDKIHSVDKAVGLNYIQTFGDDNSWTLSNNLRYSDKAATWNTTAVAYPFAADGLVFYAVAGQLGNFGTYTFKNHNTGALLGNVAQLPNIINGNFAGFNFIPSNTNFPGGAVQKNSLFFNPLFWTENNMTEITDQITITKKIKNMSFTGGAFYAANSLNRLFSTDVGVSFGTIEPTRPNLTDITLAGLDGKAYQVTNSDGVIGGGGKSSQVQLQNIKQNDLALFFGHTWEISNAINFDWGIRYENFGVMGSNTTTASTSSTSGGIDGNPLTLYDNVGGKASTVYSYDKTFNTFSVSAGLNYKFNDNNAVYVRYSKSQKAPDLDLFINVNTDFSSKNLNPLAQDITQFELGFKGRASNFNYFVTPFYSLLGNVYTPQVFQETADLSSTYSPPANYNKFETYGVELEGDYKFGSHFSVRGIATIQKSTAIDYNIWIANANGHADDVIQSFSGNKTDNSANLMLGFTPTYSNGKFYAQLNWKYMGARAANVPNAFELPAFAQTDFSMGFEVSKGFTVSYNMNNVFNQIGIMGWSAPGGFPAALDRQGFTAARLAADPNAVYSTLSIPPRATFITLSYKF